MNRARGWDFGYAPVTRAAGPVEPCREIVVATGCPVDPDHLAAAAGDAASAESLLARAPLFWVRVALAASATLDEVAARLRSAGLPVRYVASAERPSLALAPPLNARRSDFARPERWPRRTTAGGASEARAPETPGRWFLREGGGGVAAYRARGRGGAGRRLAVIDDDALEADRLDLDAEILVLLDQPPRSWTHGPLMVAWARGARGFDGVAPQASARLYVIPKPGLGVVALPLAIARAALDGADVIVCATYVEGSTSPMLDDALEVAARLGRRGRGAAVVLPTGREASSAAGSVHASFSLGFGEPASDARVFCVAPGARDGGWFLWRDRRGRLRPFGNRGPAVRWLAPGDDIAYPFGVEGAAERLYHAESSGAAAVAAGVLLLVLAANPTLERAELAAIVDATLAPVAQSPTDTAPLADPADVLPTGRDRDGHDAKHGFGRLHASLACLAASDPVCSALVAMGEEDAARRFADLRRADATIRGAYSVAFARWAVRALLADPEAALSLRVILRHVRLVGADPARLATHGEGALARALALFARGLATARPRAPRAVRAEALDLARRVHTHASDPEDAARFEERAVVLLAPCFC